MSNTWIIVNVLRARDLAIADANGFSDPYAIVHIDRQKKKTNVKKKTLNPEWNESFTLQTGNTCLVEVFDWDLGSSDDFLGQVEIPISGSLLDGSDRWYTLGQRNPNGKENVSGAILLSFQPSIAPTPVKRPSQNVIEEIKSRIQESGRNGGKSVDLSGCELTRVPQVVVDSFAELVTFNLGFNKFTVFPQLHMFAMLEELDLSGNQIAILPPHISHLVALRELILSGNHITAVPDEIGALTKLEKLLLSNNKISQLSEKIGRLRRLEELSLTGNPLPTVPPHIGLCQSMEVLDISACGLNSVPGEITYMTRLMELNLATNNLKELPQALGRLTRLALLNVSDNKLTDLPVSLGHCYGLAKIGAGIQLERNQIGDPEMLRKYRIGPDHLHDYLEKKMLMIPGFKMEEYNIAALDDIKKEAPKPKIIKQAPAPKPAAPVFDPQLEQKLLTLKRWANTVVQQEIRPKIMSLQRKSDSARTLNEVYEVTSIVIALKPESKKSKSQLPSTQYPKAQLNVTDEKIEQLKAINTAALTEVALLTRNAQNKMNDADNNDSPSIVGMVTVIKSFKLVLDKVAI